LSLDDKIIDPMAPAELPGQRSQPLPKAGKRRRKSDSALRKVNKADDDEDVGGEGTAILTLGASDESRRPQKKMLFESASDTAALAFTSPAIRRESNRTAAVVPSKLESPAPVAGALQPAPAARAPQPAPAEPVPAPVAETPVVKAVEAASTPPIEAAPQPPAAPATRSEAKDAAAIAALKGSVFQVAALVMREPEPRPEPKHEALAPQTEVAPAVDEIAVAPADIAVTAKPAAADTKIEENFEESLTLAFDPTLADGLRERMASAEEEIAPEPAPPAPTPSMVAELNELKRPETAPAAIERAFRAEPQPAPAAVVEPTPAPVSVAPVAPIAEAPKVEPKPESDAPTRGTAGLSRSEAIARAARMSARATARPTPTAAETLAAARTEQQLRSADLPKHPGDIFGYWTRVKNGRRFPSRADFDAEQVAEHWPNSMLLTCGNSIGAGSHGSFSSVLRLGANRRSRPGDDLNFTSMITEWILTTGGEAARAGAPIQDTEVFPTPDGTHAYKIVALPLSENQTRVDHVLCHLSRS